MDVSETTFQLYLSVEAESAFNMLELPSYYPEKFTRADMISIMQDYSRYVEKYGPFERGPSGFLFTDTNTIPVSLPKDHTKRLKFLQEQCAGGRCVEIFFSDDGKHCFYGDEEARYRDGAHVNTNRDLSDIVPNHDIYGVVFKFKDINDVYDDN